MVSKNKYRSRFEADFARDLEQRGIEYEYEKEILEYFFKKKGKCLKCGGKNVVVQHNYNPDFKIGRLYIETKGRLTSTDRSKMKAVKLCNPELDIRFVFQYDNWCTKLKRERYSDWCTKHGYLYAFKTLPVEWCSDALGIAK